MLKKWGGGKWGNINCRIPLLNNSGLSFGSVLCSFSGLPLSLDASCICNIFLQAWSLLALSMANALAVSTNLSLFAWVSSWKYSAHSIVMTLLYKSCNFSHYKIVILCSDSYTLELSLTALKAAVSSENCL